VVSSAIPSRGSAAGCVTLGYNDLLARSPCIRQQEAAAPATPPARLSAPTAPSVEHADIVGLIDAAAPAPKPRGPYK
jgi:hypothetical protein